MTKKFPTKQRKPSVGKNGVPTPPGFEAHPERRNNGGIPKYVREIREELKGLLDPNLTMDDYRNIVAQSNEDSGLRGVFAEAVVNKDTRTIIQLIDQAWGKPKESVDMTTKGEKINAYSQLSVEELKKLAGK